MKGYAILNRATGELTDIPRPQRLGSQFVAVFSASLKEILRRNTDLHSQSFKVLVYLVALSAWGNSVPNTKEMALVLGISQPATCRAYSELVKAGLVLKMANTYSLSPWAFWQGTETRRQDLFDTLVEDMVKLLPSP